MILNSGLSKNKNKKKKSKEDESDSDDSFEDDDEDDDEDFKNAMDAEMGSDFDDLEGSDVELGSEDEEDMVEMPKKRKRLAIYFFKII